MGDPRLSAFTAFKAFRLSGFLRRHPTHPFNSARGVARCWNHGGRRNDHRGRSRCLPSRESNQHPVRPVSGPPLARARCECDRLPRHAPLVPAASAGSVAGDDQSAGHGPSRPRTRVAAHRPRRVEGVTNLAEPVSSSGSLPNMLGFASVIVTPEFPAIDAAVGRLREEVVLAAAELASRMVPRPISSPRLRCIATSC